MLGADVVAQALDRDRDGIEDDGVFDELASAADDRVDELLEGEFDTPFTAPYPKAVSNAALIFLCGLLLPKDETWQGKATKVEARLESIAGGNLVLEYDDSELADLIEEPDTDWDMDDMDAL